MTLSIIIPAYNAEPYIEHLIQRLKPQLTNEVEVVVVDDGSDMPYMAPYEWVKVIRQKNKGLAGARNTGIKNSIGEYMHFVDADDLVPENYVEYILDKIHQEPFDIMELSWKSLDGPQSKNFDYKLKSETDRLPNPSACTRIYKRSFIEYTRFNEKKDTAEDEDFNRRLYFEHPEAKIIAATEYMYFYRDWTPNSLSKKYMSGRTKTQRIAYYYRMITRDMDWLIDEVKKADETNEVFVMTFKNELPELAHYAQVMAPQVIKAHEMRGEPNNYLNKIYSAKKAQVVLYVGVTYKIGGIETFLYNFVNQLSNLYDIMVVYDQMDPDRIMRLIEIVPVIKNNPNIMIECDTLIVNRIWERVPENIQYKQIVQMVHGCKCDNPWKIPEDRDKIVCVSKTVKESFGYETKRATVIHNMTYPETPNKALILVSATRLDTDEKGEERIRQLAELMDMQGIPYIWMYFSNKTLRNASPNLVKMDPRINILDYVARADYLVQLSNSEAFCYSIVEALELGVPVITTPLPVLKEIKVVDGKNAHVVPFDLDGFDAKVFLNIPKFEYTYNNKAVVTKWKRLLGNTKPTKDFYNPGGRQKIKIIQKYIDMQLGRMVMPGETLEVSFLRASQIQNAKLGIMVED